MNHNFTCVFSDLTVTTRECALGLITIVLWWCQWSEIVNRILRIVRKAEESKTEYIPIRSLNAVCSSGPSHNLKKKVGELKRHREGKRW